MACINYNSMEYQNLKKRSGIPELLLNATCQEYLQNFGRFPRLDELPRSNSADYLNKELKINQNKATKIDKILEFTQTETIEDAIINLNNTYLDSEVTVAPIVTEAIVDITKRPTKEYKEIKKVYTPDEKPNMQSIMNHCIDRLNELYGIKVNSISDEELNSEEWNELIPRDKVAKAFIYNGNIYINVDKATPDSLIHEMMHLLIGSLRFNNINLYNQLINSAESFTSYKYRARELGPKTRNDINEEIFVTELGKYLAGLPSEIEGLDNSQIYEINYHIRRALDSILMGDYSTKIFNDLELYNMTFKQVVEEVNSPIMTNQFYGTLNVEGSELHRQLNNTKSKLIEEGRLKEFC